MRKVIKCKACFSEWIDESFGMDWDNENPLDINLIDCCPACGCKEFEEYSEDICYKNSKCSEWKKSFDQINGQILFCYFHSGAPKYEGESFKYCPW